MHEIDAALGGVMQAPDGAVAEAVIEIPARRRAGQALARARALLEERFGAPDYPELDCRTDYPTLLGCSPENLVVWDFDYYTLSLRIDASDGEKKLILTKR